MRNVVFGLAALAAVVAPAVAQTAFLSAPEARRVFYGIDMQGQHQPSGENWRECINPDGKTVFWFNGSSDEGRLVVRPDGALCFSYASSGFRDQSCWKVRRINPTNYRFESADGDDGIFITSRTRPAQSCPGPEAATS